MDKSVLSQVLNMDAHKYQDWVHQKTTGNPKIRIFESDFLEFFSRWPWWYIFPMWIPIILYMIGTSLYVGDSFVGIVYAFVVGFFIWGFVEYVLHRFAFHVETHSKYGNVYHLFAHGLHHLSPNDPSRLTFPPLFSMVVGLLFWKLFLLLPLPTYLIYALYGGGSFGYLLYDTCHFYFHHGNCFKNNSYLRWMKKRHMIHHYKYTNRNFGVSTPLFDIIFGTSDEL